MDVQLPYADKMAQYGFVPSNHDKPNWFPVDIGKVYDGKGDVIPGYQRVFREDTGDNLAIHTESYQLIPYQSVFDMFDRAIRASHLDTTGMMVGTDMTHNGARCFRQYILPAHQIDVGNGDLIALAIAGFNSYDGSMAASLMAGAYRFRCANRSMLGRHLKQLKIKHVGSDFAINLENGIECVVKAADEFVKMEPRIRRWKEVDVTVEGFKKLVEDMPQVTERLSDYFVARYATEAEEQTLYGGWNLLTEWATHAEAKAHKAQAVTDRQKRVAQLVDSKGWLQLEAA